MAQNTTGMTLAGILKWLAAIASLPCFVAAWQGIVGRETTVGSGRYGGRLDTSTDAVWYGLLNLLYAALCLAIAWATWYFWQRNED